MDEYHLIVLANTQETVLQEHISSIQDCLTYPEEKHSQRNAAALILISYLDLYHH